MDFQIITLYTKEAPASAECTSLQCTMSEIFLAKQREEQRSLALEYADRNQQRLEIFPLSSIILSSLADT